MTMGDPSGWSKYYEFTTEGQAWSKASLGHANGRLEGKGEEQVWTNGDEWVWAKGKSGKESPQARGWRILQDFFFPTDTGQLFQSSEGRH